MSTGHPSAKTSAWKNVARLLFREKRTFFLVVLISLLSTGASLVEPLVYREAINDISGLFVRQAKEEGFRSIAPDSTATEAGDTTDVEEDDDPVIEFIQKGIGEKKPHTKTSVSSRTPQQAFETLLWAVSIIFLVNLVGQLLTLISGNLNLKLASKVEQGFIQQTFSHVLKLPLSFFSKRSSAALSKQINQSEEVSAIVDGFSMQILPEVISLIGILAIMLSQNLVLTLLSLAVIPVYLVLAWRSAQRLETGLSEYYDRWEQVSTRMQDALGGIKTVKLSGAEDREVQQFKHISGQAYTEYIKRNRLANKYVFWETMLTRLAMALVLGYGGYLTLEHQLTPGDVVMFVAYLDRLYDPIDSLASLWVSLQQNIASIARAFRLLDSGDEEKGATALQAQHGQVEFHDVEFAYVKGKQVLNKLSLTFNPGKVTAIIGPSGAGKTTLVDLVMKLYEPQRGRITIDGIDIRDAKPDSVRAQIGMVSADGAIFRGTLADNIRYKNHGATDQEVEAAAAAAGLKRTLERLPQGLKTPVGESGFGLSVGERQRIQIARVLVAKPKILILDEATANLDFNTEAEIRKTVEAIRKDSTVVVIAHRFSMVEGADYVYVLSDGAILEQGTPAELMKTGGWFRRFAAAASGSE